jgi:glycolate oxidase FAD binding subunit
MSAALHPENPEAVAAAVRDAAAHSEPLEVRGFGSKRTLGRSVQTGAPLCLDRLDALHLYEPDEMVLSVGAGTPLSRIEALLAGQQQRLAFAPPDWRPLLGSDAVEQSIGGIVAANLSGSRRLTAGAARDHLIGFCAVNGRGECFKSGGRVVKNVTGYDLSKLMAGSFGTLAVLTSVTLRVVPLPEYTSTLALQGVDAEAAVRLFAVALAGPCEVTAAAWLPADLAPAIGLLGPVALMCFEGLEVSVRERTTRLRKTLGVIGETHAGEASSVLWRALGDGAPLRTRAEAALWRVSVPPTAGARLLAAVPGARGWLDWAGGLVWLEVADVGDASASLIRTHLAQSGGHATLIRASIATRERIPVFEPLSPALAALAGRLRASFDPAGILNPGRMT